MAVSKAESGYHYKVIARAIAEIDSSGGSRLSLDELAGRMSMSAAHFQRVFSQWAGISPKKYQQYLTLQHAKALLESRHTTLEASSGAGLSGAGRLHDLFVTWEAMSPGRYADRAAGVRISYGWFDSPFGEALVMGTERGICGLAFTSELGREHALGDLSARWPRAEYAEDPSAIKPWARSAFSGKGRVSALLSGAPFQIKVWEALLSIPEGHVTTYSEIARKLGCPRASRAVGTAVGQNQISLLIPCHRVIRKSGGLGGYRWGLPVKRAILARESARTHA